MLKKSSVYSHFMQPDPSKYGVYRGQGTELPVGIYPDTDSSAEGLVPFAYN